MGNRVLIQFVQTRQETFTGKPKKLRRPKYSPVIYGHWSGSVAAATIAALRDQMADRPGDMAYVAARCLGRLIGDDSGSTGFGLWNAKRVLTADDSHGDAGIYLVDISDAVWRVTNIGGCPSETGRTQDTTNVRFAHE